MNEMFSPLARYDQDLYGWALAQAALLRTGRLTEIDALNVAEEIEGLASTEYHRLVSTLRILFVHMLKWDYQPLLQSRSWTLTIREQRDRLARFLRKSPSLKASLDEALADAYREAVPAAARETDLPLRTFPADLPYDWASITERPYPWDE